MADSEKVPMSNKDTAVTPAPNPTAAPIARTVEFERPICDWTVWLITTIGRLLPCTLSLGRMRELNKDPKRIRELLLPIMSEQLLPLVADFAQRSTLTPHFVTMHFDFPGYPEKTPTMRHVMRDAHERCLALIDEHDMQKFVAACKDLDGDSEHDLHTFVVPYMKNGKLHAAHITFLGKGVSVLDSYVPVSLDSQQGSLPAWTFLFKQGRVDRSNCFVC